MPKIPIFKTCYQAYRETNGFTNFLVAERHSAARACTDDTEAYMASFLDESVEGDGGGPSVAQPNDSADARMALMILKEFNSCSVIGTRCISLSLRDIVPLRPKKA